MVHVGNDNVHAVLIHQLVHQHNASRVCGNLSVWNRNMGEEEEEEEEEEERESVCVCMCVCVCDVSLGQELWFKPVHGGQQDSP